MQERKENKTLLVIYALKTMSVLTAKICIYVILSPSNRIPFINFSFMIYLETCSTQFNPVTNFSRLILIKLCLTNGFVGIFSFAIFIKFTPTRQRWIVVRIGQDNERPHSQYWRNTQGLKSQLKEESTTFFYLVE